VSAVALRRPVPADFVLDFCDELSRLLWQGGDGRPAATWLDRRLAGDGRRAELARLARDVSDLTPLERGDFAIALNGVQVRSKLWLIDELARRCDLSTASLVVLGAWYGILPLLANWRLERPPPRMLCIDVDPAVCQIGARVIGSLYPNIEYRCGDLTQLDHDALAALPDPVVINTSCEHVADVGWWSRVRAGQLAALQSNNFSSCPEHVNCVDSIGAFERQMPMASVLLADVLQLGEMDRYMLIGRR
jgi:hypothetical protein